MSLLIEQSQKQDLSSLTDGQMSAIFYHNLFGYPLSQMELVKWSGGDKLIINTAGKRATCLNGYYFFEGSRQTLYKRLIKKNISASKTKIAIKALKVFSHIPTVKMVAITGSLAMENSKEDSDIDLMIVTKRGTLWLTRLVVILTLDVLRIPRRKPNEKDEKDRLCLNFWLDEDKMEWGREKNAYTAHEIAQIKPILNKDLVYEKFISANSWGKDYWPAAAKWNNKVRPDKCEKPGFAVVLMEKIARSLQSFYMRKKITREIISPSVAIFHPIDWSGLIVPLLK